MYRENKVGFGFLRIPMIGQIPDWHSINDMVDLFLERGGRYFDTCCTYLNGKSEEAIRECLVNRYPRNQFLLANKLPGYYCKSHEDCQEYFDAELQNCGVTYFDVYMLHWLNRAHYEIAQKYDEFGFLREVKASGRAKRIGFSYHDSAILLDEILTDHPEVDLVQLQINYLDWNTAGIESRKCYEVCQRHGKQVIVMEPVKGGTLASLPVDAQSILSALHPDWSPAAWALQFVQSLELVAVCLSGMNTLAQVAENMAPAPPLTRQELEALWQVRDIIESQTAVPCTGCRYCEPHCPQGISIPDCFRMFNELYRNPGDSWKIQPSYDQMARDHARASDCLSCRSCVSHCPQHIDIPVFLQKVAEKLG